jgi:hypothetical protein
LIRRESKLLQPRPLTLSLSPTKMWQRRRFFIGTEPIVKDGREA